MRKRTLLMGGAIGIGAYILGGYHQTGSMLKAIARNNNIEIAEAALLLEGRHPQFGDSSMMNDIDDEFQTTVGEWESGVEEVMNDIEEAAQALDENRMFEDPFK